MVSTAFLSPSGSSDDQSHLHIVSESYGENASEGILMKQAHDNTVGDPTKKEMQCWLPVIFILDFSHNIFAFPYSLVFLLVILSH